MPKLQITSAKGLIQKTGTTNITLADDVLAGTLQKVITLTDADKDLTAADSGAIIKMVGSLTGARTVNLPNTTGAHFKVSVTAPGEAVTFEAGAVGIVGAIVSAGDEVTSVNTALSQFIAAADCVTGDSFTLEHNGTNYVVRGTPKIPAKFSFNT